MYRFSQASKASVDIFVIEAMNFNVINLKPRQKNPQIYTELKKPTT